MRVTGTATLNAPADRVWRALLDPAVLARTLPGVTRLETVGPEHYRGTIAAGVAAIKGTFEGDVKLTDLQEPSSLVLRASGAGAPGTVQADVEVSLADLGGGRTEVSYDAQAIVGGTIGGVGQRVLAGVAKKMAGQFFSAVDAELAGTLTGSGSAAEAPAEPSRTAGAAKTGTTFPGRGTAPDALAESSFVKGTLFGAAIALAGVLVGAVASRRKSR